MKNTTTQKEMIDFFSNEIEKELSEDSENLEETNYDEEFTYILNMSGTKLKTNDFRLALIVTDYLNNNYEKQK